MADSLRVLQLLGPSTGGIRRHVAFLTDQLRQRGWSIATAGPPGVLDGLLAQDHAIAMTGGLDPVAVPRARRALRPLLDVHDIVHAHGLTAGWLAVLARGRRRHPVIVLTVHNVVLDEVEGRRAPLLRALERRLIRRTDATIAVSQEAAERFAGAPGSARMTVLSAVGPPPAPTRSPATVRAALGVGATDPLIVCVARLHAQKGLDVLLDAFAVVGRDRPAARLAIIGEGPLATVLADQATALGVAGATVFTTSADACNEMAAADVVVIPSRWEGSPLVLGEAMLLGRPVVATPVGFVPDLVVDGETGWLVAVEDASGLAGALLAALNDPAAASRRATAGRARAAAYLDPGPRVSRIEAIYRASLDRR